MGISLDPRRIGWRSATFRFPDERRHVPSPVGLPLSAESLTPLKRHQCGLFGHIVLGETMSTTFQDFGLPGSLIAVLEHAN